MMKKTLIYYPSGVCSSMYNITINDGRVENIEIAGGCDGNLQGIAGLIKGMEVEDVISRMEGIKCGDQETSCPDQIAKALKEMTEK